MPDLGAGQLWNLSRYRIDRLERRDLFYHHIGRVTPSALAQPSSPGDGFGARFQSIDYSRFLPHSGESFPQYVERRRRELRQEADLLASYHELTAHLPQILDVVVGRNLSDADVRQCGKADGEPVLVMEELRAEPLSNLQRPLSQQTVLDIAEKLLMLLRVFHTKDLRSAAARYFVHLSPADILVDWDTHDCWLRNLWKLKTLDELKDPRTVLYCEQELHAFVSPTVLGRLFPRGGAAAAPAPGMRPDDLDLYSVGVILYSLLSGRFDLSSTPAGFLGPADIATLQSSRGLSSGTADLLAGFLQHRYHGAQAALDELCRVRSRPRHRPFIVLRPPPALSPSSLHGAGIDPDALLPAGAVVAGRYEIKSHLFVGGQGFVYLGLDRNTGCQVVVKTVRLQSRGSASELRKRWKDWENEARLAIQMQNLTGAVPQLVDFVASPSNDPGLAGETEPVLVLEFIPGRHLLHPENRLAYDDIELLELLRGLCAFASRLHQPDAAGQFFLYVDWKPENIVRHFETGNLTVVDLGAIVPVVNGEFQGELFSTDPYAGPEERLPGSTDVNRRLTSAYDVHGMAAVLWAIATEATTGGDLLPMARSIQARTAVFPVMDAGRLRPELRELRPIVARGLNPNPALRFAGANEMGQAVRGAIGRACALPPDPPLGLTVTSGAPGDATVICERLSDPFCARVVICRSAQPTNDPTLNVIAGGDVAATPSNLTITVRDQIDPSTLSACYSAFCIGLNGKVSAAAHCVAQLVPPPENVSIERLEKGLHLTWALPASVARNRGEIVVERMAPGKRRVVYRGCAEGYTDRGVDPRHEHRYCLYSRMAGGSSRVVECAGTPLPRLAKLEHLRAVAGDGHVTLRWSLLPGAADELIFLRSQQPLSADDIQLAHRRSKFPAIRFKVNRWLEVEGLAAGQKGVTLHRKRKVSAWDGEWTDTTCPPGLTYFYTPLLAWRDGPRQWTAEAVEGMAFAEAREFTLQDLSGAVRLAWTPPERADALRLERRDRSGRVEQTWNLPPTQARLVDRLYTNQPAMYRLTARFQQHWSAGIERTASPTAAPPVALPPPRPRGLVLQPTGIVRDAAGITVEWTPTDEGDLAIVTLSGTNQSRVAPARGGRCRFGPLPGPADHAVVTIVRTEP